MIKTICQTSHYTNKFSNNTLSHKKLYPHDNYISFTQSSQIAQHPSFLLHPFHSSLMSGNLHDVFWESWVASTGTNIARCSYWAMELGHSERKSEMSKWLQPLAPGFIDPSNPMCVTCFTSVGRPISISISCSSISSLNTIIIYLSKYNNMYILYYYLHFRFLTMQLYVFFIMMGNISNLTSVTIHTKKRVLFLYELGKIWKGTVAITEGPSQTSLKSPSCWDKSWRVINNILGIQGFKHFNKSWLTKGLRQIFDGSGKPVKPNVYIWYRWCWEPRTRWALHHVVTWCVFWIFGHFPWPTH